MLKQHHVFLSYSRVDNKIMQRIKNSLRQAGLKVWTDEGIVPGTPSWKEAIEDAIRESEILVVLMSPDSNKSIWVQREIDYADVQGVQIIPMLARGSPKDAIPFALAGSQFIEIRTEYDTAIGLLVSRCYDYMDKTSGVTVQHTVTLPPEEEERELPRRRITMFVGGAIGFVVLIMALLFGTGVLPPSEPTQTPTPTATLTETPTHTPTSRPTTEVAVIVPTDTLSPTATNTPTSTASKTSTNTPTETRTPTITWTPSPSPTPSGELLLRYNANSLVIYNRSDGTARISNMEFTLITEGGNDLYTFTSSSWGSAITFLASQQCVQVWRNEFSFLSQSEQPATICRSRRAFRSTINEFWIADWDDAYFEVRRFGIVLTTCPAIKSDANTILRCIVNV